MTTKPTSRADLMARLDALDIKWELVEHPAVFTVAESEAIHKHDMLPGGHVKNLFLKDKKGALFLITVLHDAEVDLKGLHKILECGRLSFGKPDLLMEVLGVEPGSVTPLAAINDTQQRATVILDARMMTYDALNVHPLENTATVHLSREDLVRFLRECGHEPRIQAVDTLGNADATPN